ncbi:MAG: metallophosphoesterase family protein [Actinomycetota bacterium]
MRVAALYDIHGNLPALRAVLTDVERAGADLVLFGGDLAWGPLPRETMDVVMTFEENALFVRGNADREVAARLGTEDGLDDWVAAVNTWAADELTQLQRDFLQAQSDSAVLDIDGVGPVFFCHGSPRSDEENITTATPDDRLEEMLAAVMQPTVVCGHTHAQFERGIGSRMIVNAGSVGLPFGPPGAYWALLGPERCLMRTTYDYAEAAEMFRSKAGPGADDFAEHVVAPPPFGTAAELWG